MRVALFAAILIVVSPVRAAAQETASSQSAQTAAPNVSFGPQPASCGAAPNVAQINKLILVVRRMFPQPAGFNAVLTAEMRRGCPRNSVAAYLVHLLASNSWAFAPPPFMRPGSWPMGTLTCGPAASSADLNVVIGKLRPLFADPAQFNAAVRYIGQQPCVAGRATLYLFALMADNDLALRR